MIYTAKEAAASFGIPEDELRKMLAEADEDAEKIAVEVVLLLSAEQLEEFKISYSKSKMESKDDFCTDIIVKALQNARIERNTKEKVLDSIFENLILNNTFENLRELENLKYLEYLKYLAYLNPEKGTDTEKSAKE